MDSYGLKPETLADIIRSHRIARAANNSRTMDSLENTLTDINYHTIRDLIHAGEYDKAAAYQRPQGKDIKG